MKPLSRARLLATPWTAAYQAPPSMGFSRQEYWSGLPLIRQSVTMFKETCCLKSRFDFIDFLIMSVIVQFVGAFFFLFLLPNCFIFHRKDLFVACWSFLPLRMNVARETFVKKSKTPLPKVSLYPLIYVSLSLKPYKLSLSFTSWITGLSGGGERICYVQYFHYNVVLLVSGI